MRRPLATVVITIAAVLSTAACSGDGEPSAATSTASPSAGTADHSGHILGTPGATTSGRALATGNAAKVCAEALKTSSSSAQVYVAELGKMLQATGTKDTTAAQEAERRATAAISGWSEALRKQAAEATDQQLKDLLAEIAREVGTMKADMASIEETTLERLQQRLDELCGA